MNVYICTLLDDLLVATPITDWRRRRRWMCDSVSVACCRLIDWLVSCLCVSMFVCMCALLCFCVYFCVRLGKLSINQQTFVELCECVCVDTLTHTLVYVYVYDIPSLTYIQVSYVHTFPSYRQLCDYYQKVILYGNFCFEYLLWTASPQPIPPCATWPKRMFQCMSVQLYIHKYICMYVLMYVCRKSFSVPVLVSSCPPRLSLQLRANMRTENKAKRLICMPAMH